MMLHVKSATSADTIRPLAANGWIARRPNLSDSGAEFVSLTAEGRKRWETIPDPIGAVSSGALEGIPSREVTFARDGMKRVVANLQKSLTKGEEP